MTDSAEVWVQPQAAITPWLWFSAGVPCPTAALKKPTSSWNFRCQNLLPNWTRSLRWCTSTTPLAGLPSTALPSAGWGAANPAAFTWRRMPCLLMERLRSCENVFVMMPLTVHVHKHQCMHTLHNTTDELTGNCYIYLNIWNYKLNVSILGSEVLKEDLDTSNRQWRLMGWASFARSSSSC